MKYLKSVLLIVVSLTMTFGCSKTLYKLYDYDRATVGIEPGVLDITLSGEWRSDSKEVTERTKPYSLRIAYKSTHLDTSAVMLDTIILQNDSGMRVLEDKNVLLSPIGQDMDGELIFAKVWQELDIPYENYSIRISMVVGGKKIQAESVLNTSYREEVSGDLISGMMGI